LFTEVATSALALPKAAVLFPGYEVKTRPGSTETDDKSTFVLG
jgi:hypothetical protein